MDGLPRVCHGCTRDTSDGHDASRRFLEELRRGPGMAETVSLQVKSMCKIKEKIVKGTSSVFRHSITWWRSRCVALEHENKLLRDKVRSLAQCHGYRGFRENYNYRADNDNDDAEEDNDTESDTNENLEFNVTEDLLNFFETSERHKREMRLKRECSETEHEEENLEEESFVGAAESIQMKKDEADLLQGDAGSKILAMETVPQSTIEQYEDTAN